MLRTGIITTYLGLRRSPDTLIIELMSRAECPFKVGDAVVYKPTQEGQGRLVMTGFSELEAGKRYKIVRIIRGVYIVPEGFENVAAGGIYWTEFAK
jgi:hypothetical protein